MRYDFDTPINRRNTFSFKWDCDMDYFGRDDVIPMWVADMDFACAPCVVEAVQKRAAHPVYGYGMRQQPYYDAVMGWLKKRHGFEVKYEHLAFAPPGVIYALNVMLRILTKPGDRVMVPMPNYDPLFDMVTRGGRKLVETPLVWKDGRYTFDFADMEAKAASGVKVLVLSSPHNPTGRVWTRQELEGVAEICLRHNIFMLVDEIHCDFVPPEHPHTTFGLLGETPFFGLSGNPAGAFVGFELFVRPALRKMMGHTELARPVQEARATHGIKKRPGRAAYNRARVERAGADGELEVMQAPTQNSALLVDLHRGNCLVMLDEDAGRVDAGEAVAVLRYDVPEGTVL
mgnify:CR=1 FL=1